MKATIYHDGIGPKAFYLNHKIVTVGVGEKLEGDFEDGLLIALKKTGFTVDHEGTLKVPESVPVEPAKSTKSAKSEAAKIIADAKTEAEEILKAAKEAAEKMIAEAEELAKSEKAE